MAMRFPKTPNKGPSDMAIFFPVFGTFSYGMYPIDKGNKNCRALAPASMVIDETT
ncbi:NADH dehydrogenase [Corchorus olitorius]|uniref:NADH dehydrogenase n=1 Tax=Corchorus olitorius TaxID=93759 RepID=A0A1R3IA47_9ROSI|nr:NADH dehydrogenase [Corchorus olitorius]